MNKSTLLIILITIVWLIGAILIDKILNFTNTEFILFVIAFMSLQFIVLDIAVDIIKR